MCDCVPHIAELFSCDCFQVLWLNASCYVCLQHGAGVQAKPLLQQMLHCFWIRCTADQAGRRACPPAGQHVGAEGF